MKLLVELLQIINNFGSFLIKIFLKLNGAKIGKNTFIHFSAQILVKNLIIGNDVKINNNVKIKGNKVRIGHNCIVSDNVLISGKNNFIMGDKSYIGKKVHIDLSQDVLIGEDVGVGENTVIWTHGYFPPADKGYPVTLGKVEINSNAWVSTNIVILPNVIIGENVIVGAGSVVTKKAEDNSIIAGNPAKKIKNVEDILHNKSFTNLMREIFSDYFLNKVNDSILYFNFNNTHCYIIENYNFESSHDFQKKSIIMYKSCTNFEKIEKENSYLWMNFNSRVAIKSNNLLYNHLLSLLRENGIRFIFKY